MIKIRIVARLAIAIVLLGLTSCGGDHNDHQLDFDGTLQRVTRASDAVSEFAGVVVCALGNCGLTDDQGRWKFRPDDREFQGGDVLFTFQGPGLDAETVVPGISGEAQAIHIDFGVNSVSAVEALDISTDAG